MTWLSYSELIAEADKTKILVVVSQEDEVNSLDNGSVNEGWEGVGHTSLAHD